MLLTIPYNPTLPCGYDKLVSAIQRHGKHPLHTLFVASQQEHEDGAFELAMKLKDHFGKYFAITLPPPAHPETMLKVSNRMFVAAMDALRTYKPTGTDHPKTVMLYMDPSWRPTKPRWLDEFQSDYYLAGAPKVFGHFKTEGDKARIEGPVAVGIDFLAHTQLLNFIPPSAHWRDYLAWEMVNVGVRADAFGPVAPAYIRPFDP